MMNPRHVLIFGIETQALGILRLLSSEPVIPILVDKDGRGVARYSRHARYVYQCPDYNQHHALLRFFLNLAERHRFNGTEILLTDDEQIKFLSLYKKELEPWYRVHLNEWHHLRPFFYKHSLYRIAGKLNIMVPKTVLLKEYLTDAPSMDFPLILKPSGKEDFLKKLKKKAIQCDSPESLQTTLQFLRLHKIRLDNIMVQEIIPGRGMNQYSCVGMAEDGVMRHALYALRKRQHPADYGKASTYVELIGENYEMKEIAEKLLSELKYTGPFEIECKLDEKNGQMMLLDFNMRFWGWHSILEGVVNLPKAIVFPEQQVSVVYPETLRSWINLLTDLSIVFSYIKGKELTFSQFLHQLITSRQAIWRLSDPLPFIFQILLIPHLYLRRGR
jgi:D-aspartate ligase